MHSDGRSQAVANRPKAAAQSYLGKPGRFTAQEAQRDISHFFMHRYNWIRPHQFNDGLAPARAEEKLKVVSGIS